MKTFLKQKKNYSREYFKHNGYADRIALRDEMIRTDDTISAIRATDVSGQNGSAVLTSLSDRFVELALASDDVGRGFDFRVQIYSNVNSNSDDDDNADEPVSKTIWNCCCCK